MTDKTVHIELSADEALVLFEFLSRFVDGETLGIQDQAEERVLWDLQAGMETKLSAALKANYGELLESARAALRDVAD